jgi:hypothetical protein
MVMDQQQCIFLPAHSRPRFHECIHQRLKYA